MRASPVHTRRADRSASKPACCDAVPKSFCDLRAHPADQYKTQAMTHRTAQVPATCDRRAAAWRFRDQVLSRSAQQSFDTHQRDLSSRELYRDRAINRNPPPCAQSPLRNTRCAITEPFAFYTPDTTLPMLKIGKSSAIATPPIKMPMLMIITGSIYAVACFTASSSSCSLNSAMRPVT